LKKGPEIRTGNTPGDVDIPIQAGLELNITTDDKYATASDDKNLSVYTEIRGRSLLTRMQLRRLQKHYKGH
jgi:pyruvate kinase